jgi:hypothetical protein
MNMLKITLATLALTVAGAANAGFVHNDWKTAGDGKSTLHEETGIEWLKISETQGESINTALDDPEYAGWRLATQSELNVMMIGLIGDIDYPYTTYTAFSSEHLAASHVWREYVGITSEIHGWALNIGDNEQVMMSGSLQSGSSQARFYKDYTWAPYSVDYTNASYGIFLVSDGGTTLSSQTDPTINANNVNYVAADVPVAFAGLFSLFGLAFFRRSKS